MEVKAVLEWARDKPSSSMLRVVSDRETLSPLFFIIVLDNVMRKVKQTGSGMKWVGRGGD